ncbi:GHKL domain-containing protein [Bacillus timonensis]|nr:GHKL domain-containing protein [Bacillus timonensis]
MKEPVIIKLLTYLETNLPDFLESWKKKVIVSEDDVYISEVQNNGLRMFQLVKLTLKNELSKNDIVLLANKIARERVEAKVNIGEFVYNVNIGRSEIIKYMNSSKIPVEELEPYIEDVNYVFDQFSYYAVTKYTEIKECELQEKIHFIDESHQERLTILGQMSSTFVHEFRNPLTAVIGFIKLIGNENPNVKYLDIISQELNQLNYRISQFLHVSKKEIVEKQVVQFSISELLHEILEFLYASILDGEVDVQLDLQSSLQISANVEEIRQVFLNIILNSIDALKHDSSQNRKIMISSKNENGVLNLSISNNGPVIPSESLKSIFEPFYTTKEFGTGIGLFVCKRIIEKYNGTITCQSSDESTTFNIFIPLHSENTIESIETLV